MANELVKVGEEMLPSEIASAWEAAAAEDAQMTTGGAFPVRMSTQGGVFAVGEDVIGEGPLYFWVVGKCFVRSYYQPGAGFDPKNPITPLCYSMMENRSGEAVATPHPECGKAQAAKCAVCPHDAWGTAVRQDGTTGNGKACGSRWRLGCIVANGTDAAGKGVWLPPEEIAVAPMYQIDVAMTSGKACEQFFSGIASRPGKRPHFSYVTAIKLARGKKKTSSGQIPPFEFEFAEAGYQAEIGSPMLEVLSWRYMAAKSVLMRPFYRESAPAASAEPVAESVKY